MSSLSNSVHGDRSCIGIYETAKEAALQYDKAVRHHKKDINLLNWPTKKEITKMKIDLENEIGKVTENPKSKKKRKLNNTKSTIIKNTKTTKNTKTMKITKTTKTTKTTK